MKVSFNGESYILRYDLYRKMAPATVKHFLELVDSDYYTDLCVHNYTDSKWYTGGYEYDENQEAFGGLKEKNYFDAVSTLKLTSTVWEDSARAVSTKTLYGEFQENGFKVEGGSLGQSFGSLTMYYTSKAEVIGKVYTKRSDGKGYDWKDYKHNSATSLFYISMTEATVASPKNYCTFATLQDESADDLRDLKKAVADYIADQKEDDEDYTFYKVYENVPADTGDSYLQGNEITCQVPLLPIVIKWVKVLKY
jgi:cyclophilin family peptidyl-prolyl cis-trans isomerase